MTSFDYRLNPLYPIKECSSYGDLYPIDYCCSEGSLRDRIICDLNKTPDLSQRPPQNCPKCGNPVDSHYCQGCALLRKKFKEDLFTYCIENGILQDLLDASEPSNNNTNIVNALQEPFVVKQDPDENSHKVLHKSTTIVVTGVVIQPFDNQTVDELPQTVPGFDPTCYSEDVTSFTYDSTSNLVYDSPNVFNPPLQPLTYSYEFCENDAYYGHNCSLQVLSLAWETILEIELVFEDKHCQPEDILELFRRLHNDVQNIHEELAVYINSLSWDRPTICYNDDDDEDCTIAITPILSTEEPDNSLCIGDKHLDTLSAMESDKLIKSSVENLVPILSESIEDFFDSNDDSTSIDDDFFSIDNIEYVEASPPDSELTSSEVTEIVIPKVGGIDDVILLTIKDDILREKLLNINLLIANIESLKDNPTPFSDFMTKSDFYEFVDELAHIISPPEYDCFCFKNKPNSGDFTMDVVEDTFPTREPRVHVQYHYSF
nr:hypothetical protein [Tanacetum cinerariifolium]